MQVSKLDDLYSSPRLCPGFLPLLHPVGCCCKLFFPPGSPPALRKEESGAPLGASSAPRWLLHKGSARGSARILCEAVAVGGVHMTNAVKDSRVFCKVLSIFLSSSSLCTVGSQLTDRMWGGLCHQNAGYRMPSYARNYTVPGNLLLMSGCRQPEHIETG